MYTDNRWQPYTSKYCGWWRRAAINLILRGSHYSFLILCSEYESWHLVLTLSRSPKIDSAQAINGLILTEFSRDVKPNPQQRLLHWWRFEPRTSCLTVHKAKPPSASIQLRFFFIRKSIRECVPYYYYYVGWCACGSIVVCFVAAQTRPHYTTSEK